MFALYVFVYHFMPLYVSAISAFFKASSVCSSSNHIRRDKFKNGLHVQYPALAPQSLLTMRACP